MLNQTLIQKADLALSELTSGGGVLTPAQADKFYRILIDESVLMKEVTVTPMKAPKQRIDKVRFASRILKAGTSGSALASGDRSKPELGKQELDAKLFKAEVRLPDETLEDSIEGGTFQDTIMQLAGERIALDMEEWIVNADTTSGDTFLAAGDGVIKAATTNVVNHNGGTTTHALFTSLLKSLPTPFIRNRKNMRFYLSVDSETDYREAMAARGTVFGDQVSQQETQLTPFGIPARDVPVMPENLGQGQNQTVALFTDPKNINVGVWRKVKAEVDKDITQGVIILVFTVRFDVKYIHEPAVTKATGIAVA